jgi:Na+/H+ antiporter NhaC
MNTYLTWAWQVALCVIAGLIVVYICWDIRVRNEKITRRAKVLLWRCDRILADNPVPDELLRVIRGVGEKL